MHSGCMHGNHIGCPREQQYKERDSTIFPSMFFIGWILIGEHPNQKYKCQIFRSIVNNGFLLLLFYSTTIDLEMPRDKGMHLTRSKV